MSLVSSGAVFPDLTEDGVFGGECKIESECVELAVKYLRILVKNIGNYETQERRIAKQNRTMSKYCWKSNHLIFCYKFTY